MSKKVKPRRKHACSNDPDFAEILRNIGLKATQPRLSILNLLFHEHGPFAPDEIHQKIRPSGLDLTTVYRTTAALAEAGVVVRCEFGDGISRFEFQGTIDMAEHHHHIICRVCKKVTPLEVCVPASWKNKLAKLGYSNLGHALEFFGTCNDCGRSGQVS